MSEYKTTLKHTESRSSLICNQNIKEDIPKALEVSFCLETKRNETKQKDINKPSTKISTQRASNLLVRTGYHVQK